MTEKLFYKDPYIREAECEVENILEKDSKYHVVLKSTPFYPEGGGQPSDLGSIDGLRVEYVYEEDDIIYHVMSEKLEKTVVNCLVDYDRRVDHVQQHSGEHLMSAAFYKLFGASNDGFHFGEEYVTIDILLKEITEEMIKKAEKEANSYVFRNEEVKTYFLSKEEAQKLPMRKAIKAEGNIRIVQMGENIDFSSCCGTQVNRTGEVGIIKITKWEKYKGMTRVYVKCGFRALNDYMIKQDIVKELAKGFSVQESEILNKIKSQNEEIEMLKNQLSSLNSKIAVKEAENLLKNSKEGKFIIAEYSEYSFDFLEKIYDILKDEKYILILTSLKDMRLLFSHNGSFDVQCGKIFKEKLKDFNGRGGGSPKRAQANFSDEKLLRSFVAYLQESLK